MRAIYLTLPFLFPFAAAADHVDPVSVLCDLNGDGKYTTTADYAVIIKAIVETDTDPIVKGWVDLNRDKLITSADFALFLDLCPFGG